MFYKHSLLTVDEEEVLYLYLEPTYEFAQEFHSERKQESIYERVTNYIRNQGILFHGSKVYLVINGIVVSSLTIAPMLLDGKQTVGDMIPFYKYVEVLHDFLPKPTDIEVLEVDDEPVVNAGKFIDVKRSSGILEKYYLEDYTFGVVCHDMSLFFEKEAKKARAVLARTFALRQENEQQEIREFHPMQRFQDKETLQSLWREHYKEVTKETKDAVEETRREYLAYKGRPILAYTHIVNHGKTEDAKDYLFVSVPYLKSVDSSWDLEEFPYLSSQTFSYEDLSGLLNQSITEQSVFAIDSKTEGDRVKQLRIGSYRYRIDYLVRVLGLRGSDFTYQKDDLGITFTYPSLGNGLGMSIYGANAMAKKGFTYRQILEHYFPHTEIKKIS